LRADAALRDRLAREPAPARPEDEGRQASHRWRPGVQAELVAWRDVRVVETGGAPPAQTRPAVDPGEHPDSETPGRRTALLYSTISNAGEHRAYKEAANALASIKADLELQDYQVQIVTSQPLITYRRNASGELVPRAGSGAPRAALAWLLEPWGVLFIDTHGSTRGHLAVERFTTVEAARARRQQYSDQHATRFPDANRDDFYVMADEEGAWYVAVSRGFIARNWRDADTVAYIAACFSNTATHPSTGAVNDNYAGGFGAARHWPVKAPVTGPGPREFIGHDGEAEVVRSSINARLFFAEMAARLDDGKKRPAARAYKEIEHRDPAAGTGTALRRRQGIETHTVLSPAVIDVDVLPYDRDVITDSEWRFGRVRFDGRPAMTWSPNFVVKETGCIVIDRAEQPPRWVPADGGSAYGVDFRFRATMPGSATLRVPHYMASSRNNDSLLDGNQSPAGPPDHVGPNRDDYVWGVICRFPEPPRTLVTPTPTPTPSTTPAPAQVVTPSPTPVAMPVRVGMSSVGISTFTTSPTGVRHPDGSTIQFAITVTNTGSGPASNVVVRLGKQEEQGAIIVQPVPPGGAAPAPGGTSCAVGSQSQPVQCAIGTLEPGASVTVLIVLRMNGANPMAENRATFTASVDAPGGAGINPLGSGARTTIVLAPAAGIAPAPSPAPITTPAPAGAQTPRLELSRTSGRAGEMFTVSARGFTPNSTVRVCWVGPGGACQTTLYSGTTGNGTFSFPCYVPGVGPGAHLIDATDGSGVRSAVGFTVVR
jgi:hypothetical protein